MNPKLRSILFWIHLVSGLVVGLVVGVMSLTGVALAFESQIVDWADRDARHAAPPEPATPRLSLEELLAKVKEARPGAQPSAVTVYPEANSVVAVATGRNVAVYVHPYTGEVREQGAQGWRAFFQTMEDLHRWLATSGEQRAVGKGITGVSNLAFLLLGITGLFLWWPRKWTLRSMRPTLWFRQGLKGKARDFNWHNVIGFWSLPVLLVLTTSGAVISYKWASNLVFTLTGNPPPPAQGPIASPPVAVPTPAPDATPQGLDAQFAVVMNQVSPWETITLKLPTPPSGGPQGGRPEGAPRGEGRPEGAPRGEGGPRGEGRPEGRGGAGKGAPQASAFTVREQDRWPLFSSKTVSLDPYTAQPLRTETYADFNSGRKVRTWLRFLHTGEALGWVGQLVAALASFGAVFLVYTGYALSWRRFVPRRRAQVATPTVAVPAPEESKTHAA
ncbi:MULTISPECIES: PepSY domain-containing protein [Corallococcus]|uniref:PepSY-associated TM helix domain-containing protein n=1 Tax=Corallococcus TaxID=83461 RepID=UPI0011801587|nr:MULTISPECIES: PepSY-associated TM helix domain-containing protein [Corallococcus]NBD11022.1 PepSY domain-containing protein [Corallococcus silvisoli]TSC26765.1 PepSY domain-containing protein [Corallococcus sp. Z5C101001]